MAHDWVTIILLAFGILVGVIGVIAYLQLFRKEKLGTTTQHDADAPSSDGEQKETSFSNREMIRNVDE